VKLLEIQSSPRGESSDSITLTKSFIEACKNDNASIVADTLNVWHERLPEFDYEAIGAKYKAVKHETMTEAESNIWERIQSLIQRFQSADRIVLGTPMWNFGLPYKLKQDFRWSVGALGSAHAAENRGRQHRSSPCKAGNTGLADLAPDERLTLTKKNSHSGSLTR
jgi:putative NADPH-quinone reductase